MSSSARTCHDPEDADPLAAARAAVTRVLSEAAEHYTLILQSARREADQIVADAQLRASGIVDDARDRARTIVSTANADAAHAHREAIDVVTDLRHAIAELSDASARICGLVEWAGRDHWHGAVPCAVGSSEPTAATVEARKAQPNDTVSSALDGFLNQVARQLDHLDRARLADDSDELGQVLQELADLADRNDATELAEYVRRIGPDAGPEELDGLIGQCYRLQEVQEISVAGPTSSRG